MKNRMILEAANAVMPGNNDVMTVETLLDWFNNDLPANKHDTYVKAIISDNGPAYEVKGEFMWAPNTETAIMMYLPDAGNNANDQMTAADLINDMNAISDNTKGVKVDIAKSTGQQNYDENSKYPICAIFIPNTNTVYLTPFENHAKFEIVYNAINDAIRNIKLIDGDNVVQLDQAGLLRTANRLFEENPANIADIAKSIKLLMTDAFYKALPADVKRKFDAVLNGNVQKDPLNKQDENPGNNDNNQNLDDLNRAPAFEQPDVGDLHANKPAENLGQNIQNLNGLNYAGVWEKPNMWDIRNPIIVNEKNWEYAVALSPLTEEEFKQQMNAFPPGIARGFTLKPTKFVHIDNMEAPDPTHNALRYFFIFDGKTNVTWKQIRKKQTGVLRIKDGLRDDLFKKMLFKNGKQWKSLFYNATSPKLKAGDFDIIFAEADKFQIHRINGKIQNVIPLDKNNDQQQQQPQQQQPIRKNPAVPANDRDIIISVIRKRLQKLIDNGFALDRSIKYVVVPKGQRKKTIVYGREYDPARGLYVGPNRRMTNDDADLLAQNYDNWTYSGYDNNIFRQLQDVLNPATVNVAAEKGKMDDTFMKPDRQDLPEDIKKTQDNIDTIMKKTRFLTATIVKDNINRRPVIPNDGKPYLDVRIPGKSDKTLVGDPAVELLTRFKVFDIVKQAQNEAEKIIPGIQIIITMNNKVAL